MSRGKGQTLITLGLFTGIVIIGIATVVTVTIPVLENLRDSAAVDSSQEMLADLQEQIERVADGGEGSQVTTSVSFSRGNLIFDASEEEVAYEIDTGAEIIAPHTSTRTGNLVLSAMASTSVTEAQVDGQDCWRVENDHVRACIRKVDEPEDMIEVDTVGFWRFTQGSGQTAVDNSSRGNNGTLGGSSASESSDPSRVSGLRGNALEFDGSDDYVEVSDDSSLDISKEITVSVWVNLDEVSSEQKFVDKRDDWQSSEGYSVFVSSGNLFFEYGNGTDYTQENLGNILSNSADRWTHIAVTLRDVSDSELSEIVYYVNGTRRGTDTGLKNGIGTNNVAVGIGKSIGRNGQHLDGTIDEVRIWNRSLSAEEVEYLYNSSGYLDYVDTRKLLLNYRNRDEGKNLSADFRVKIDTGLGSDDQFTMNGTGTVTPSITGKNLGRGRVTADIESFYGLDYQVVFQLFSGSDFLQVQVEENVG